MLRLRFLRHHVEDFPLSVMDEPERHDVSHPLREVLEGRREFLRDFCGVLPIDQEDGERVDGRALLGLARRMTEQSAVLCHLPRFSVGADR